MIPNSITVQVTAEDIAEGTPSSFSACPIALAVSRLFENRTVRVTGGSIRVYADTGRDVLATYDVPWTAHRFINSFDNGEEVQPLTFNTLRYLEY